jgi:arsenate reductase-like glutaredoxin family protein
VKQVSRSQEILTAKGVDFEAINYMEEPLAADALKQLLGSAGLAPREAMRTNEPAYWQHVEGQNLSDGQLIQISLCPSLYVPGFTHRTAVMIDSRFARPTRR